MSKIAELAGGSYSWKLRRRSCAGYRTCDVPEVRLPG
jgi:hypothetical protein